MLIYQCYQRSGSCQKTPAKLLKATKAKLRVLLMLAFRVIIWLKIDDNRAPFVTLEQLNLHAVTIMDTSVVFSQ